MAGKKSKRDETVKHRCHWVSDEPIYVKYHDEEWGVPVHDDRKHFEFLVLEGAQAGLSWITILKRREGYRKAFANFDPARVAKFDDSDVKRLMADSGIIRNQLKIRATISNASHFLAIQKEFGSFNKYFWQWVGGGTIQNRWKEPRQIPPTSAESDALAKDLKKRGFKFAGSTIMYAHMQACGLVNDHLEKCFRYREVKKLS